MDVVTEEKQNRKEETEHSLMSPLASQFCNGETCSKLSIKLN